MVKVGRRFSRASLSLLIFLLTVEMNATIFMILLFVVRFPNKRTFNQLVNQKNGNFLFVAVAFVDVVTVMMVAGAAVAATVVVVRINAIINYVRHDRCFLY